MKIENLNRIIQADRVKVAATVVWEDCDRSEQEVFFETTAEFGADLQINPNSFLLACALPAMHYGEKRVFIDAPICPEIKDGLINAMKCLISWYNCDRQVISIEAPVQAGVLFPNQPKRAGALFSGGIDALAMVRDNHLNFAPDHPRYIKDGILVYGILQGETESDPSFQNVIRGVSAIAKNTHLNLIQVYTNAYAHFRDLDPDFSFWRHEYIGSFLSAIAHAFAPRLAVASIASTYDFANLEPWGSHPLLDPLYGNTGLQIRHENAALSRLEKTKLVGEWDVALKHLRVCNEKVSYSKGNYNCGKCEKCVKTMTTLLSLGLLDQVSTFIEQDVSQELLLNSCYPSDSYGESSYRELIEPLSQIGRYDLVDGIEQIIKRYHEQDIKGLVKRLDRAFFGGSFQKIAKKIKSTINQHSLLTIGVFCLILFSCAQNAIASPLTDRLEQFPQWNSKPVVQLAKGDLQYPEWMSGTWDVTSTLIEKIAPLAPKIVTPGFEDNDRYLRRAIAFQVRFGKEYYSSPQGLFSAFTNSQPVVVADRAFNGEKITQAYLGNDSVYQVKVDPLYPNQQITFLKGDRKLTSKITGRAREIPEANQFMATEVTQQLFKSPERIYLNEVETTSAYELLEPGQVTAQQITAIYLSPQDPDYFRAGDRPVALYHYRLDLKKVLQ